MRKNDTHAVKLKSWYGRDQNNTLRLVLCDLLNSYVWKESSSKKTLHFTVSIFLPFSRHVLQRRSEESMYIYCSITRATLNSRVGRPCWRNIHGFLLSSFPPHVTEIQKHGKHSSAVYVMEEVKNSVGTSSSPFEHAVYLWFALLCLQPYSVTEWHAAWQEGARPRQWFDAGDLFSGEAETIRPFMMATPKALVIGSGVIGECQGYSWSMMNRYITTK